MHQGCRFNPGQGCIQRSTNEYVNGWSNKSMFLSLSFYFSLKSISKIKENISAESLAKIIPKPFPITRSFLVSLSLFSLFYIKL